jgi:transcriptional regulator with XRE-family HTH domain
VAQLHRETYQAEEQAANNSIDVIDRAIGRVSMQRASLGAMQNRLESTIRNLTDYSENLTAAESRIRDADMAQEMIKYTKYTILQQMTGISESFMGHIERGGRTLSIETLAKLANALNLSIEYIVCGEFNYQPDMLPAEVHDSLKQMSDKQRKVFLDIMKTLAAHPESW